MKLPSVGWRIVIALSVVAAVLFLFCPKAFSQDVMRGERLAKTWCVNCHNIYVEKSQLRNDAVPALSTIAARPENTQSALENFLHSKHPRMPAYGLRQKEIRDVVAYIMSLSPKNPK